MKHSGHPRPVGHVTSLIGELNKWKHKRENKGLNCDTLMTAMFYLTEYRELLAKQSRGEL